MNNPPAQGLSALKPRKPIAFMPFAEIRTNVISGIVVGIVALPLAIALAIAVGAPPIAGLYTSAFAGGFASLFGGSRYTITGPTAALVPLLTVVVIKFGVEALPIVGAMAGILLFVMTAFKLGRLMKYMPGLVIIGFTAGIGLSIAFGQIASFLNVTGTDPTREHFHERMWDLIQHLNTVSWATPLIGIFAVVLMLAWPFVQDFLPKLKAIPPTFLALIAVSLMVFYIDIDTPTVATRYGDLPGSFPKPTFDWLDLDLLIKLIPSSIAVAILMGVETLLTAVMADNLAGTSRRHKATKELFGQGVANIIAPIFGGIPATAAIARTGAGIQNGATSRLSGITHAVFVLTATIALGSMVGHIPMTVLAAILIVVAWRIISFPELVKMAKTAPRQDHIVLFSTLIITVTVDLTYAIAAGVFISLILLLKQLTSLESASELEPDENGQIRQVSAELSKTMQQRKDIIFFNAQGLISFHSAFEFERRLLEHDTRPLILRMKDVKYIDTTGLMTLDSIVKARQKLGSRVMLSAIQPTVFNSLRKFGILESVGSENVFAGTALAIENVSNSGATIVSANETSADAPGDANTA
ncbi:MAG TPA: SulP family inorganic anion transporter [Dehalococcoidia bacterium]|nr:SulP family inorganic anion transporter [Dehalococcoidia bacterium]HIK88040.1 SulP family inorganic anion transporter [Dehalococcoidia bacterium]